MLPAGARSSPPPPALAVPYKGCGLSVPSACRLFEPRADLLGVLRMLPREGAALEDPLDGLGPVQPSD